MTISSLLTFLKTITIDVSFVHMTVFMSVPLITFNSLLPAAHSIAHSLNALPHQAILVLWGRVLDTQQNLKQAHQTLHELFCQVNGHLD